MGDEATLRFTGVCPADFQMKVAPPRTSCAGKRRPRPGGFFSSRSKPSSREEEAAETPEEVLLRGMVSSLKEQNDLQRSEIAALRCPTKQLVEAEAQTDADAAAGSASAHSATVDTCEAQQMQLDMLHQEVGDKSRELRRSQDTVKLLRSELEQQRQVSEQYRLQTEMLEEELRRTTDRLKKLEKASAEARHTTSQHLPEMPSSSLPKSWKGATSSRCFSDEDTEDSPEEQER